MQKNLGKIKRTVEEYVVLTVATLILVVGVYVFKFPNNFSFGGVTGLAVVLGAVLPTSPGNLTFIINMLLLVLGFIFLGRGFGVKTVYVSVTDIGWVKLCGAGVSDGCASDRTAGIRAYLCARTAGIFRGNSV